MEKIYELIGGPLDGAVRRIDMTIEGVAVKEWSNRISIYRQLAYGGTSARAKTIHPSLLYRGTVSRPTAN